VFLWPSLPSGLLQHQVLRFYECVLYGFVWSVIHPVRQASSPPPDSSWNGAETEQNGTEMVAKVSRRFFYNAYHNPIGHTHYDAARFGNPARIHTDVFGTRGTQHAHLSLFYFHNGSP